MRYYYGMIRNEYNGTIITVRFENFLIVSNSIIPQGFVIRFENSYHSGRWIYINKAIILLTVNTVRFEKFLIFTNSIILQVFVIRFENLYDSGLSIYINAAIMSLTVSCKNIKDDFRNHHFFAIFQVGF